ncbi:hypothetical protein GCM10023185_08680 [Hymenobacter saemangeumensis]|uniref:Fibronectin type-III domain-containing protein n=1 Tax=Hymenobacter saemangeumensis TaxID=1084522 RepID=A0ABP8I3S2_9BACT
MQKTTYPGSLAALFHPLVRAWRGGLPGLLLALLAPLAVLAQPSNDECTGAISLTPGGACAAGTLFQATESTVVADCPHNGIEDVWYSFVATSPFHGITLNNPNLDMLLEMRQGACGAILRRCPVYAIGSSTDSISAQGLVVGQTYFVRVYATLNVTATPATGVFSICVTTPGPCAAPSSLIASNITNTAADLSWSGGGSGVDYEVEYGPAGFTPGTGTRVYSLGDQIYSANGLSPATAYQFYVTQICGSGRSSSRVGPYSFSTTGTTTLVVSTAQNVQGTYDFVTITATGVATLTGPLTVNQRLRVQDGGVLVTNCQPLTGSGSFEPEPGSEVRICHAQGLYATGAQGAVQMTGNRVYANEVTYTYNGTVPQSTGPGLPSEVQGLVVNNAAGLTLNNSGVGVTQALRLLNGNLNTNGQPLRLLSRGSGTALVDNTGGVVNGTAQVERHVESTLNAGLGYRHLSAPVQSAPISQLSTAAPVVVNPAYNAAAPAVRPNVTPFPTVFFYNEALVPTGGSTLADFDQGWLSPTATSDPMVVGRGYTVQVAGGLTATFTGPLNNGPFTSPALTYSSSGSQAGWHLLGNPYPSPIDWSTMSVGSQPTNNLQNMNGAVYVYQSTGRYSGTYRSYQNGIGGNPLIASGQGFFVRAAGPGQTGTVRMSNANRVTAWTPTSSQLFRGSADLRPRLQLTLAGSTGISPDETSIYFEAGATAGPDAHYDAYKLRNPGPAANLFSVLGSEELSINGLAPLGTQEVAVPLGLALPQAGQYTLRAEALLNFGSTALYLRDAHTGALVNLRQQPAYSFQVSAAELSSSTRFSVVFRPAAVTGARGGLDASQVALFPNPARHEATLLLPALPARTVAVQLYNALGQSVLSLSFPTAEAGSTLRLPLQGLAAGVYILRISAGSGAPLTKRLVIE